MNEHKEASIISEKVAEEIKYLEGIGYSVKKIKNGIVELGRWKLPPFSFLFYFLFIFLWPILIINWLMGYHYRTFVYENNGEIVVSNNPPKDFKANDNNELNT